MSKWPTDWTKFLKQVRGPIIILTSYPISTYNYMIQKCYYINYIVLEKLLHSDLDDRALDALKEFPADGALAVLAQFLESNLEHVSNKSAYLCGVMKTYRQKSRSGISLDIKSTSTINGNATGSSVGGQAVKGPDEEKIKEILERTGYTLDVTTGQRKFGGPPPGWEGEPPSNGCEVSTFSCDVL